jgi:nitrate/TMAO reductase-like tetraheme cytochrome c subunit
MKVPYKYVLFVFIGIILAIPIFSMSYYSLVRTLTPHFCVKCHEIEYAYKTWKTSSHAHNSKGVVADCMGCHLPAPQNLFQFFYMKTLHGTKDIIAHFMIEDYDHKKNKKKAYQSIEKGQCLKCHRNLLYMPYKRGAMLAQSIVLYTKEGYEKKVLIATRT